MAHPATEYINKLKHAYRNQQLVPFVGAGLSFPFEMPGWGTLIDDVCKEFDYETLAERKGEISRLIKEYRYLDAVDEMTKAGILEDDLKSCICSAIQRKKQLNIQKPDNIYKDLVKMNCTKYLTTNYDNYLSDYVGKGPSDITHLYKEFINELDDPVYHKMVYNLHGDYTKPSSIVLSRESYDDLYRNSTEFKKVLEHFRERYTLLFIGVSLDDEYIQEVLEVSKDKLKARHYMLLANVSSEQRILMEQQYNIRILKYSTNNGDHTRGIRAILDEIINVSDEVDKQEPHSEVSKSCSQDTIYQSQSMIGLKTESLPLLKATTSLPGIDSAIYEKVKEIEKLQKSGNISEAIIEYNRILQGSIFEPLSHADKKLVIKGMLYCYILIRDYPSAAPLVEAAMKLPKNKEDVDLLSYIVDYYFNISDFQSAYKTANEWYGIDQEDPLLLILKVYTEAIYKDLPYERVFSMFLTEDGELLTNTTDDNQRQYIYRLIGEIALRNKKYNDAIQLLRRAYEIDDNLFNIEDLGIATYFKAIEMADNGTTIKVNAINLDYLSKAVEYIKAGFARAKGSAEQGIYARVAVPYLRSLFYLKKTVEFDRMYDQLIEYCGDDLYEMRRMKAVNNMWLNKFHINDVNGLNEIDKALVLSEFYNMRGMYKHAIKALKPIVDKSDKDNEDTFIQFLATLLNAKALDQFNEYFVKYSEGWQQSEKMPLIRSFYYEVNGMYEEAEKVIRDIIERAPSVINYNILIAFYRRTGQLDRIGEIYEGIMKDKPEIIEQDPDGFYIVYHDYLMQTNNVRRALWLYFNKVKNCVMPDIRKFIEVDLKIKLRDFCGVVESSLDLYEKYRDYGEMIYAYYAAVAYLHYNDFEKSRHYLNLYKANGHVDPLSNSLVKKVEERLDILQKKTDVDCTGRINHIKDIASKAMSKTQKVSIPKGEPVVIDAPALYVLFNIGEKQWLKDNSEVFITFTAMEQLHNVYCYCGDALIFEIIEHIRNAHNIHLASPSMEGALNNRENYPGIIQEYFDSLTVAFEKGYPFVTAYNLPIGFQNGLPVMLPEGLKTIRVVNQEILVYTSN